MIGRTIGKYRILEKLGRGGMGTVYKALDETLNREVAVKVLNPDITDTDVMRRFQAEARALAKLSHPEIATIHEIHRSDHDLLMVMEFVRGETLEQLLARSGMLPPERAAYLIAQILGALAHAHQAGVVHRDLKPSNVMVTEYGGVKIMDFGIARVAGAEHMTAVGFMVGTPAYMSPERILGNEVDGRADLYSVGVLFYRLLTGQLPFSAANPADMVQQQLSEAPTPARTYRPDLPAWCEEMLTRALAKSPADRFQTAEDFRAGLLSAITSASDEQTGLYAQPGTAPAWESPTPDALTIATATPPFAGESLSPHVGAGSLVPDATMADSAMSPQASAVTAAATATPPLPTAIPVLPTDVAPARVDVESVASMPPVDTTEPAAPAPLTSPDIAVVPTPAPQPVPAAVDAPVETSVPAAGTLVMKKPQFAVAGALLGALALGVVVLGVVVLRKPVPAEVASTERPVAPVPVEPAPAPITPPVTAPPIELSDPAPIPVGEAAPRPAVAPPLPSSIAAAPRPPRPVPAAGAPKSAASASSAPAAPTTADGKPLVTAPFTFEAKAVVVDGDRGRERDASVLVADGNVTVTQRDNKVLYVVPVSNLTSLTYSNSKQPLWNSPNGPAEAMRVESGAFGFLKGGRHWVGLRTSDSLLVLRVEDGLVRRVITGLQERSGLTVARLVEPKE